MNKKGEANWLFLVLVGALIYLGATGQLGNFGASASNNGVVTTGGASNTGGTVCPAGFDGSSITATSGPIVDKFAGSGSLSGMNATYVVDGIDIGQVATGSTFTVGAGASIDAYYGLNNTQYYTFKESFVAPCRAFRTAELSKNMGEKLVLHDTSFIATAYNGDNGLASDASGSGGNESVAAGEEGTWKVKTEASDQQGFAPGMSGSLDDKGKALLILEYNNTVWDTAKLSITATSNGAVLASNVGVPTFLTVSNSNNKMKAFEIQGTGKNSPYTSEYSIKAGAKAGQNPTELGSDLQVYIYPYNWIRDSRVQNSFIYGLEDSTGRTAGLSANNANESVTLNVE